MNLKEGENIRSNDCIDSTDLFILDILQDEFPIMPGPWNNIADRVGIPVDDLLRRISKMQDCGVVKGITPVLESEKFGLRAGTLIALHIRGDNYTEIVDVINSYPEVSHNYLRDHHYSVWFTMSAPTEERISDILSDIKDRTGILDEDILNLPTVCKYKIDVRFSCSLEEEYFGSD